MTLSSVSVLLLSFTIACTLSNLISEYSAYPFDTDEATHSLSALKIAQHLNDLDFTATRKEIYTKSSYPPLAAVLRAFMFLLLGASTYSARFLSSVCLALSIWPIFLIGIRLDRQYGWFIGLFAVIATLTSMPFLVLASRAMLEMPGLLTSMVAMWLYLSGAGKHKSWIFDLSVGLAIAAVMLTKYPYGIVVLGAIVINEAIESLISRYIPVKKWALIFSAFISLMIYWFWEPWKINRFFHYATSQPHHIDLFSIDNLVYYPRVFILHYSSSFLFSILVFVGVLWTFSRWRNIRIRALLLYSLIGLVIVTIKTQNEIRFISTYIPAFYILTGAALTDLWSLSRQRAFTRRGATMPILIVIIVGSIAPAYSTLRNIRPTLEITYETDPRLADATAWIAESIDGHPFCVIDSWDQLSRTALRWHMASRAETKIYQKPPAIHEHRLAKQESILDLVKAITGTNSKYLVVLQRARSMWSRHQKHVAGLISLIGKKEVEYRYLYTDFAHDRTRIRSRLEDMGAQDKELLTVLLYKIQVPREGPILRTTGPTQPTGEQVWPAPQLNLPLTELRKPLKDCLDETIRLEFDRQTTQAALLGGWSGYERTGNGESYVWAVGHEASLTLKCCKQRNRQLSIRLWPCVVTEGARQNIRGILNGHELGIAELRKGSQVLRIDINSRYWQVGINLLVIQFSDVRVPAESHADSGDQRPLAAAFDWLEISDVGIPP